MKSERSITSKVLRIDSLRLAAAFTVCFILLQAALEFYRQAPLSGTLLGKFSWKWVLAYMGIAGILALLLALALALIIRPGTFSSRLLMLAAWRRRSPGLFTAIAIVAALLPPALLLLPGSPMPPTFAALVSGPYVRLLLCLASAALIAMRINQDPERPISLAPFLFGLALTGSAYILFKGLSNINDYPFTLTWSEGNRLFEFSLRVNPGQYVLTDPANPRNTGAGREILWGLPFLLPAAPIWVHRAWDAALWIIPHLALGYALALHFPASQPKRFLFAAWVLIFLSQGPIYAPIVISALIVAMFVWAARPWLALLSAPLANYYAAASRWTWLPAPAGLAGLLLLDNFNPSPGESISGSMRRLLPIALITGLSLAAGLLTNPGLFMPQTLSSGDTFSQPLLWQRLLPSPIYPEGIILALILATGAISALLCWLAVTRRWALNPIQALAYTGVSLVFLAGGLVVSVKIGGGNNLHNLDMFLITLAFLAAMALRRVKAPATDWPTWANTLLVLACLLPAWKAAQLQKPSELPAPAIVQDALREISNRATKAARRGEVLFVDQRQLFTFGQLPGIQVVTAYEKRYMMDKAMAGDAEYFQQFYRDLADKRFTLIVIEPLYENLQSEEFGFQEENNAWVNWVSKPLLCFYAPVDTLSEVRTQLLTPKADPQGCEAYLNQ